MITYTNPLNMTPGDYPITVNINQYDSDFQLIFELYSSIGTLTIPSGTTAEIRGTKRDGNGYSETATLSGTTVTVDGDIQMTAVAGMNVFEIVLYYNDKELSSANFILAVERAAMDKDSFASDSKIRELVTILDNGDAIIDAAHTVEDAMGDIELIRDETIDARDDARRAAADAAADVEFELNDILIAAGEARDEAVAAAETAAADVHEELSDDITIVVEAKEYIENYIEGLIYGDEVGY